MTAPVLRALVTGASAGLGAAFASTLADRGVDLVLVARREDRLRALADDLPVDVEILPADLADRHQLAAVEARLASRADPVDLLVNDAGFGMYGPVAESDPDRSSAMIDVNVQALTRLTHAVLPQLLDRQVGGVINVGSTAGFQPGPNGAVYGATKAYVRWFTEALHVELADADVHALLLAPGVTATEFQSVAEVPDGAIPGPLMMDADAVVDAALRAFARGDAVCVPGAANRVAAIGAQVVPSAVTRRISGLVHRRFAGR